MVLQNVFFGWSLLIYFFAARTNEYEYLDKLVGQMGVRLMIRDWPLLMVCKERNGTLKSFLLDKIC